MALHNPPPRRVQEKSKQGTFFGGAAILAAGIMVVKLIGMFYKIPLANIIGEQGTADFYNAYNIYAVLLTISTTGLPVAISKLVSEANAVGRKNQVRRIFRLSLILFLSLGAVSFLVMFFKADALAAMMNDAKAAAGIKALAPAVICVGCLSAFRGYTQGHSDMAPTSISQIIEALCKLLVGLGLAYALVRAGSPAESAAAGAIAGVTVGTMVALAYMWLNHMISGRRSPSLSDDSPDRAGAILKSILLIAIPITISSSMVGIVTVIDSSLVQGQLQKALLENPASWELYKDFIDFRPLEQAITLWNAAGTGAAPTISLLNEQLSLNPAPEAALAVSTALQDVSRTLFGNYSNAINIHNLPPSLMAAVTAAVIPAVSGALARKDHEGSAKITGSALRITALLTFPMGVGLMVMGKPIMQLLFPSLTIELAGPLLSMLGLAAAFSCMMLVCNSILQAHGFVNLPVVVMVLGGVVKIIANYNLVAMPSIGIYGAPIGNVLCFALCLALDLVVIARVIPRRPRYLPLLLKPLAASALMGGAAWGVYGLLAKLLSHGAQLSSGGNAVATLAAIAVAMVIYLVLVIVLKAIGREDLELMPKGAKIAKLLHL